jgi:hypothetical protein
MKDEHSTMDLWAANVMFTRARKYIPFDAWHPDYQLLPNGGQ